MAARAVVRAAVRAAVAPMEAATMVALALAVGWALAAVGLVGLPDIDIAIILSR